jgi:hypothetical protein
MSTRISACGASSFRLIAMQPFGEIPSHNKAPAQNCPECAEKEPVPSIVFGKSGLVGVRRRVVRCENKSLRISDGGRLTLWQHKRETGTVGE